MEVARMTKEAPGQLVRHAMQFGCIGCQGTVATKNGLFIYHRPNETAEGWGVYVSHLNPTCICNTFVHYIMNSGFDPVETMIALDTAIRALREKQVASST